MKKLRLALDWTPNINHIGFFTAREKGFYREAGIELDIIDPSSDDYALTPAKKVELKQVDFALCPTESLISYRTKKKPSDLIGVATVFQEDLSAIAVRLESRVESPKNLDHKTYASYKARYEDKIIREMIKNDGGEGQIEITYPNKLGIWDTLINGCFDSTWVFLNWEGVEAQARGASLKYFKLVDYGIPYSYSPLLVTSARLMKKELKSFKRFMSATRMGHEYCRANPEKAVTLFRPFVPQKDKLIDLNKALSISIDAYGEQWGKIEESTVTKFLEWIYAKGIENEFLKASSIVSNELFRP